MLWSVFSPCLMTGLTYSKYNIVYILYIEYILSRVYSHRDNRHCKSFGEIDDKRYKISIIIWWLIRYLCIIYYIHYVISIATERRWWSYKIPNKYNLIGDVIRKKKVFFWHRIYSLPHTIMCIIYGVPPKHKLPNWTLGVKIHVDG